MEKITQADLVSGWSKIYFRPNSQQLTSMFIPKIIANVSNGSFLARLLTLPTACYVNFQEKNSSNIPQHWPYPSSTVLRFSRQTGEPQIGISSTPSSNKLPNDAAINLTCTAWQTNELAQNPWTRPYMIEWFDPQYKRIGIQCRAGWPPARRLNCTLEVGALTDGKLGNYTCRARNGFNYCRTKTYQVDRQQGK